MLVHTFRYTFPLPGGTLGRSIDCENHTQAYVPGDQQCTCYDFYNFLLAFPRLWLESEVAEIILDAFTQLGIPILAMVGPMRPLDSTYKMHWNVGQLAFPFVLYEGPDEPIWHGPPDVVRGPTHQIDPVRDTPEWTRRSMRRGIRLVVSAMLGIHLQPRILRVPLDDRRMMFSLQFRFGTDTHYASCGVYGPLRDELAIPFAASYRLFRSLYAFFLTCGPVCHENPEFDVTLCIALPNQAAFLTRRCKFDILLYDSYDAGIDPSRFRLEMSSDETTHTDQSSVLFLTMDVPFDADSTEWGDLSEDTMRPPWDGRQPVIRFANDRDQAFTVYNVVARLYDEHLRQLAEGNVTDPGLWFPLLPQ